MIDSVAPGANSKRVGVRVVSSLVFLLFVFASVQTAWAVKPEKKFKGDIIISTERFPSRFKSDNEFVRHMKKVNTKTLTAQGDESWEFEYMAFLPKPVSTLKAAVTYYDITVKGSQKYIETFAFYPSDRSDKILAGHAELSASKFSPDRKYLMVFSLGYGQKPLASTKFVLRRKGEKKAQDSGVVDFE
ncbi:hypothetical protein [Bradymonas sediminis]|uniref:Uncharacterized protein n=1 Tax=Bradymonas sediminis TaxID=1548548 RepID=A0A2Z4FL82_9DELT|nr:hypothetical protein [Bradymonas sediminis]AWV89662.1 hypothetical protein DN745_10055 [Bradymonas sediminis]TDP76598.1 hypothetical protein DFR33_102230 [Bradymonas sediminis]